MTVALYATIWVALFMLAAAEAGRRQGLHPYGAARWAWPAMSLGAALLTAHVLLALASRYGWDHDLAVRETARQAAAVYGFEWRGNIYVSYAFVLLWLIEAARWRGIPARAEIRPPLLTWIWRGFFFVIIFNAAVVFATTPWSRALGVLLVSMLAWAWWPQSARGAVVRG